MSRVERRQENRKSKWPKRIGITLLIVILAIAGYVYYIYHSAAQNVSQMYQERPLSDKRTNPINLKKGEPISVLLLGVDEREGDKGRSDTMVVMTINPGKKSMIMVSIPRDTRVEIPGKGLSKINHAYAYGGVDLSIKTVEQFLDIPVDFFYQVNMESFQHIVDTFGGVDVTNDLAFSAGGFDFPVGDLHLDGKEALAYSRMRKNDPQGDFGRQDRQKDIILGIIDEAASIQSVPKLTDAFEVLGDNVKTNMTFKEMKLMTNYRNGKQNVEQYVIKGSGKTLDLWYYIVPEEERVAVSQKLRNHLELE